MMMDKVGEQIESKLSDGKTRAADTLSDVAQTLLTSSQQLREQGNDGVSRYVEKAADQVDRVASYLQTADVGEMVDRVEDFARRQPVAFMAGAFAVGFLASRFLKSSRDHVGHGHVLTDTGRSYTSNIGAGRPLSSTPRNESWRTEGYAATSRTGNTSGERDVVGDPSVRTSVGFETDNDRNRGV